MPIRLNGRERCDKCDKYFVALFLPGKPSGLGSAILWDTTLDRLLGTLPASPEADGGFSSIYILMPNYRQYLLVGINS